MLSLNPDTVIVAVENKKASMLNDEMIVLNLDSEQYYVFNESATAIWLHLQQPTSLEAMLAKVADTDQAELKTFLVELAGGGLIVKTDRPAIAREIDLSQATAPSVTCMGGIKELVAMAGSAGDPEDDSDPTGAIPIDAPLPF